MKQNLTKENQFQYLGRWVDKKTFRTFVYRRGEQKLAKSYEEYLSLIESGLWFEEINKVPKERKPKHAISSANS